MKHPIIVRLLAVVLAVLTIVGPGAVSSGAAAGSTGGTSNSLTDLLSAIKYSEYLKKYNDADYPIATQTVTLEGDAQAPKARPAQTT